MNPGRRGWTTSALVSRAAVACLAVILSQQQSTQDLATAAQNPIAAMYSLPFQNNTYFGVGPLHNETANVLNIQPVIPISAARHGEQRGEA